MLEQRQAWLPQKYASLFLPGINGSSAHTHGHPHVSMEHSSLSLSLQMHHHCHCLKLLLPPTSFPFPH
ncbi:hypothetical protein BDA96_02G220200 [Sorghum bicolor]|uniref:Uncharacterized protein n=2 Tax=Sorghum bicolor TaxID=4558 RepID=A0A921RQ13_SORBI|nr:hypothetical protein BDA96_02G220200 [Sorghum bicolor]OQU89541.1 hypothetical protein SORBI_3002G209450 [Sorghum bicolor]